MAFGHRGLRIPRVRKLATAELNKEPEIALGPDVMANANKNRLVTASLVRHRRKLGARGRVAPPLVVVEHGRGIVTAPNATRRPWNKAKRAIHYRVQAGFPGQVGPIVPKAVDKMGYRLAGEYACSAARTNAKDKHKRKTHAIESNAIMGIRKIESDQLQFGHLGTVGRTVAIHAEIPGFELGRAIAAAKMPA